MTSSTPLLRLSQTALGADRYRVEVTLEQPGKARRSAEAELALAFTPQDREDLRWYLEDFLRWPQDPNPTIAAGVERRMAEVGEALFRGIFESGRDAERIWVRLQDDLGSARVEVVTEVEGATALPWELLRDPETGTALALAARSFVRTHPGTARSPVLPEADGGPVRILLAICRPRQEDDVPFRSVASKLVKGLGTGAGDLFELTVLRPPTFEQLGRELRRAKAEGKPYHVLHFDGHGAWLDTAEEAGAVAAGLSKILLSDTRKGKHGYLLFENPEVGGNAELVDGPSLGRLLHETGVPVLVLNACRSAHAEGGEGGGGDGAGGETEPPGPETAGPGAMAEAGEGGAGDEATGGDGAADPHARIRALGSLAQEVADHGAAGVVAMRYNVYVVTAAQFVAELYASLAHGRRLGEAVTLGRKNLAEKPWRTVIFDPLKLQDWSVPVVYEAAPLALFPEAREGGELEIRLGAGTSAAGAAGALDPALPPTPDAGFFGRDETLLALDRAFDRESAVLLHAYAGSGKTATAAEFARWYALTGGVKGPVLFTTFEQHRPLARVLDQVGQVFGAALEQGGVHWLALDDDQRRQVALQVLAQVPVLWIWDNVEPVAGFPAGADSAWSDEEQRELADFLRAARETKAKFLLTSRRDERGWLEDLPRRIAVPPMPTDERWQLVAALAERHGRGRAELAAWRPLLAFSGGNPLTLTVLAGQALRQGWTKGRQIASFVDKLRAGEAAFEDQQAEGRARSLGASLAYGFEAAFSEEERRRLALLHLFQGFVQVQVLQNMGYLEAEWCLPEVRGLGREEAISLLDRAAEVGLLSPLGPGGYRIHPALPWFFRGLFEQGYGGRRQAAVRAFVEAMGGLGGYYHDQYIDGNREVIGALGAEEANLLHARALARRHGWWGRVISAMQGLRVLYGHTGRRGEWKRLVEEIVPDFVDPETGGPRPGREEDWSLVTGYRVLLAEEARDWEGAERLQRQLVEWCRERAAPLLERPVAELGGAERNAVRSLAVSLEQLGHTRREMSREDCVGTYLEALGIAERIGDHSVAASCAFNLGHAYMQLQALRDLDQAERWYRRSLELRAEGDRLGRARCVGQLGLVAWERFDEARAAGGPEEELLRHINEAARRYHQALDLSPPDAVNELAVTHNALGAIYGEAGDLDRALTHYRQSIHYEEQQGNRYGAAQTRFNVAVALAQGGRREAALEYARAALRGFEGYGAGAAEMIERTRGLIAEIEGG